MLRTLSLLAAAALVTAPAAAQQRNQMRPSAQQDHFCCYNCEAVRQMSYMAPGTRQSAVAGERIEVRTTRMSDMGMISPYPATDQKLPDRFWNHGFRLTPREFVALRAQGLSSEEAYMVANAAQATRLEPRVFVDAIFRGMTPRDISLEYGIAPGVLTRVQPEWRTAAWGAAIDEPPLERNRLRVWNRYWR